MSAFIGLAVVAVAVVVLLASRASTGDQTRHVAVPARTASAAEVAMAFVAAIQHGDCATADALYPNRGSTATRCSDGDRYKDTSLRGVLTHPPMSYAKEPADQLQKVEITRNGQPWGFFLERATAHDPWRITDEGMG